MGMFEKSAGLLTRTHIKDLRGATSEVSELVREAQVYADGGHRQYIEKLMAQRFATHVVKASNPNTGADETYLARSVEAAAAAIKYGLMEVASLYTMPRIVRELAALYAFGAEYEYSDETIAEPLAESRQAAEHDQIMSRADWLSVSVGSSAVLVQTLGARYNYQAIPRQSIWAVFAESIEDDDEVRPVDRGNMDEASCVVIQLASKNAEGKSKYAAYFGRSDKYPQGRFVTYYALLWSDVPEVGADIQASEYMIGDEIANPLTAFRQKRQDWSLPEYPVLGWNGGQTTDTGIVLPTDTSLYLQCREIDLAASRVLMSSLKAARGLFAFSRAEGASPTIPENLDEGIAILEHGTTIETKNVPGVNSQYAMDVIDGMASHVASAYGIPPHRMTTQVQAQLPSGAALAEANKPLEQARLRRYYANKSAAARKFRIECALAAMLNDSNVGDGVIETWRPKSEPTVSDRAADIANAEAMVRNKWSDGVRAVMSLIPQLDTQEKAQAYLDSLEPLPEPVQQATQSRLMTIRTAGGAR